MNDGAGAFTLVPIYLSSVTEYAPGHVAAADFNRDGKLDLALADPNPVGPITNYSRSFLGSSSVTEPADSPGEPHDHSRHLCEVIASADLDQYGIPSRDRRALVRERPAGCELTIYFGAEAAASAKRTLLWGLSELPTPTSCWSPTSTTTRRATFWSPAPIANGMPTHPCTVLLNRFTGSVAVDPPAMAASTGLWLTATPNPASRNASVSFHLPARGRAVLEMFDVSGRRLSRADEGELGPGVHQAQLVRDGACALSPGVYLARLSVSKNAVTKRLVVAQ